MDKRDGLPFLVVMFFLYISQRPSCVHVRHVVRETSNNPFKINRILTFDIKLVVAMESLVLIHYRRLNTLNWLVFSVVSISQEEYDVHVSTGAYNFLFIYLNVLWIYIFIQFNIEYRDCIGLHMFNDATCFSYWAWRIYMLQIALLILTVMVKLEFQWTYFNRHLMWLL